MIEKLDVVSDEDIKRAVKNVTHPLGRKKEGVLSAKSIAVKLHYRDEVKAHHKIDVKKYDVRFRASEFATIVREAARLGDFTLFDLMLPEGYEVHHIEECSVNGKLEDNIAKDALYVGTANEHFNKGDYREADKALIEAEREIKTMRAEVKKKLKCQE